MLTLTGVINDIEVPIGSGDNLRPYLLSINITL
jgi:hypothetical protein